MKLPSSSPEQPRERSRPRQRSTPRFRALSASGIRENFRRRRRSLSRQPKRSTSAHPPKSKHHVERLGIDPTLYHVVEEETENTQHVINTTTTPNNTQSNFLCETRGTIWNESQGVVSPMSTHEAVEDAGLTTTTTPSPLVPRQRRRFASGTKRVQPSPVLQIHPPNQTDASLHSAGCSTIVTPNSRTSRGPAASRSRSTTQRRSSSSATVNIFLLLVEPKSRSFEIIDLTYPRHNTNIADLLRMIPRHSTEPLLRQQQYIGFTTTTTAQPLLTDPRLLASNSIHHGTRPSAHICPGQILIAIPAHTSAQRILHVARPILQNERIQRLLSVHVPPASTVTRSRDGKSRTSRRSAGASQQHNASSYFSTSTMTCVSTTPVADDNAMAPVVVTPTKTEDEDPAVFLNRDIVCNPAASDGFFFAYCEREIERAQQAKMAMSTTPPMMDPLVPIPSDAGSIGTLHSCRSLLPSEHHRNVWCKQMQARKRRIGRTLMKWAPVAWVTSVAWYAYFAVTTDQPRSSTSAVPLGLTGALVTCLVLVTCIKLQWTLQLSSSSHTPTTIRCPIVQAMLLVLTTAAQESGA